MSDQKGQFVEFERADGSRFAYPLLDLRWQVLCSESELELGFVAETVRLRGRRLGPLFCEVACDAKRCIKAVPQAHAKNGEVYSIRQVPHR
jgi:hypothetical protein